MSRYYPLKNIADKIEVENVPGAEAWTYESDQGVPYAYGWRSTRQVNHDFHHRFKDAGDRDRFLTQWFDQQVRTAAYKQELAGKKRAQAARPNPFKLRDVLVNSWGYDQTNVDFYQVVGLTPSSVKLRKIASEIVGGDSHTTMSDYRAACYDTFVSEEVLTKRVQWSGDTPSVCMDHGHCGLWNGKPEYCSYYA